jgi:DNA recombination protein RmuC
MTVASLQAGTGATDVTPSLPLAMDQSMFSTSSLVVAVVLALLSGGVLTWLGLRGQSTSVGVRLEEREKEVATAREALAAAHHAASTADQERERMAGMLDAERNAFAEKTELLEGARIQLKEAFAAASQEALQRNNQVFLDLANAKLEDFQRSAKTDLDARQQSIDLLVKPVNDELAKVGERLLVFDRERATAHAALQENLRLMSVAQEQLAGETQTLVRALRAPQVRGQWGEMQLHRVVELAGMVEYCDFVQQQSVDTIDGKLRPDMVVRLPGEKLVVVDSKAPLAAYLDAMEASDEAQRGVHLDRHAKQVRDHITALSAKDYANEFAAAPDFVVLFLPGESFFSAACQRDPNLIDFAIQRNVIPASPTTLITVLKAVNYGWQQERIAKNAEEIRDLGQTLYERIRVVAEHFGKVRKGLEAAVNGYNSAVGAMETRVLPTARKFRDLDSGKGDEIATLEPIDTVPRLTAAPELLLAVSAA